MATVYKAYHPALDRYVALKVLHPAFLDDRNFLMRFQREARVVAKLEHPHIVPVYDFAEHEGQPYLVMKYIEGRTLKARIAEGPLTADEINSVVEAVGTALAYAHERGILHRDIKPSNVMIASDGQMYLADFGLARIAQAGESTLSSDSIMGTPQYISPEQAMGKKELDDGTDIYSFGVMLYELVVGQVPFSSDTPFSVIHDHIYTALPLPTSINATVPEPVERVLLKALAKERADRFDTVTHLVGAFRQAWTDAGVPMRGTRITLPPSTLNKAASRRTFAAVPDSAATVAARSRGGKRAITTLAVAAVVLALLAAAALALRPRLFPKPRAEGSSAVPGAASPAASTLLPQTQAPPPAASSGLPVAVETALAEVQRDPSNADVHLALSLAFWDADMQVDAMESLTQAANLAGPTDGEFFNKAAADYRERGAWTAAAAMYMRAVQAVPAGSASPALQEDFSEAVYRAASEEDMPNYLFFERIDRLSEPLGFIARSRNALFHGSISDAQVFLDQAKRLKPNLYEAFLLEGEIRIREGRTAEGEAVLVSLSGDLGAPEWVRAMAGELLGQSQ